MKFADFNLHEGIKLNLKDLGFDEATPIQELVIPHAILGKDISGLAQTGTGKTAAFLLPIIHRILKTREESTEENAAERFSSWHEKSFALCLVPTRELATQVAEQSVKLSKGLNIHTVCVVGGEDFEKQVAQLEKHPVDILIATPGRLIDLYKSNKVDLKQVEAIIFDEADRMFDMGFKDDVKYILRRVPEHRQYLLFSATTNLEVLTISYQFGAEPVECHLRSEKLKADNVKDQVFHVGQHEKAQYLLSVLKRQSANQVIIFTNLKRLVLPITEFLQKNSYKAVGISSLLNQRQRNRVLSQFKEENTTNILVATDVAARGLDVEGVDMVINFDLPDDAENYVHRIGRTGRAGKLGVAFSLSSDRDVESLSRIQEYIGHKVEIGWLEDADILTGFAPLDFRNHSSSLGERKRSFEDKKNQRPKREFGDNKRPRPPQQGAVSQDRPARAARPDYAKRKPRSEVSNIQPKEKIENKEKLETKVSSPSRNKKRPVRSSKNSSRARKVDKPSARTSNENSASKKGIAQKISTVFKKLFG